MADTKLDTLSNFGVDIQNATDDIEVEMSDDE
jgi:hypothetical protein